MKARVLKGAVVGVTLGAALGVGGYTFLYARGASSLTHHAQPTKQRQHDFLHSLPWRSGTRKVGDLWLNKKDPHAARRCCFLGRLPFPPSWRAAPWRC